MRILSQTEVNNILLGATILGTGGGGSLPDGLAMTAQAFAAGKQFKLVDFSELPEDALLGTPYYCGAISPLTPEEAAKYADLPEADKDCALLAAEAMEQFLGKKFAGFISTELGGGNTAAAMYAAAMSGVYMLDADAAGRSVPDLQHSTYYLHDIPITPQAVANEFGETAVITRVVNDKRSEALVRALAVVSRNTIGVIDHVNTAGMLKDAVIKGAITYAGSIGKAWEDAKASGQDPIAAAVAAGRGRILCRGAVTRHDYSTVDGFTPGDTYINSEDGAELHIWYKNENIVLWKDGQVYASVPDLICVFDTETAMPMRNPLLTPGQKVTVALLPADPEWTTKKGLETFGPRSFGFNFDYTPAV